MSAPTPRIAQDWQTLAYQQMPQAIMEMEEIEQRIASDQLIEGVPWDWVVINGRMARCINPFFDLPDAADGWKSVQRPIRLPWGRLRTR